jgi:hypothetical protein
MDTLYRTSRWTGLLRAGWMNLTQRYGRGYRALSSAVEVESSSTLKWATKEEPQAKL